MGTSHQLRLLILFMGMSMAQRVRSWKITVPETVTAVEGSCVVVPCKTDGHSRSIWYRYHATSYPVVYDERSLSKIESRFRGRTLVQGNAAEGNCTLVINNVQKGDNNLRVYVWINPDSESSSQRFYDQLVTIVVVEKAPTISIQEKIVDGEMFHATCTINHSCPMSPPVLHWIKSQLLDNLTLMTANEKVQGQWLYTEVLHGLATYEVHTSIMWCSAQFSSFIRESQKIKLDILYKPMSVTVKQERVLEGDGASIMCDAKCNPQPHMYMWFKREKGQTMNINSTQSSITFDNIKRDTLLSCVAHNDMGAGQSEWLELEVQYAPEILPESSCQVTGAFLKCICHAEASPNASINWTINGNSTLPSSFHFVSRNKKNTAYGMLSGPATNQSNISCTATNSVGRKNKQLLIVSVSNTSSLTIWLTILGVAMAIGCAMFIYRKYSKNRNPPGSVSNAALSLRPASLPDNIQPERIYNNDPTLEPSCEGDRSSTVYDNDFQLEMRPTIVQRPQKNATSHQRELKTQPLTKDMDCDMSDYLNC